MTRVTHAVLIATLLTVPVLVERASAHHGAGRFDTRKKVELEGKLTRVDFVNPHTYVYFDVVGNDGKVIAMKCETRGATVLRRSGWSPEMFVRGASIKVAGSAHRDDPTACTVDTMTIGNKPTLERYQQLSDAKSVNRAKRPLRLANGKPNLAGDWAQEQQVLASPPGGRAGLVPISQAAAIRAGKAADACWTCRLVPAARDVDRRGTSGSSGLETSGRRRRTRGSPVRSRASCSTGCLTARSTASHRARTPSRWSTAPRPG